MGNYNGNHSKRGNSSRGKNPQHSQNRRGRDRAEYHQQEVDENLIPGRNGVLEALQAGRTIDKIYISDGNIEGSAKKIVALAKENGIPVVPVPKTKLDTMYFGNHQGVIAKAAAVAYADVDDILVAAAEKGEAPLILVLAEIESPHNLGAILRTADIVGAHGVIIPKNNSVGLNSTVMKTAAGAGEYVPVAKVTNLVQTVKSLKKQGLWVYGAAMDGECFWQQDMTGPMVLIIGGEDRGIPRLLAEECDFKVAIPMSGHISSLNASVAAGVLLYEVCRQRSLK